MVDPHPALLLACTDFRLLSLSQISYPPPRLPPPELCV